MICSHMGLRQQLHASCRSFLFFCCMSGLMVPDIYFKHGWLMKRGELNKGWKRRWFEVRDNELYYYKHSGDAKAISSIPLHPKDTTISRFDTDALSFSAPRNELNFRVRTPKRVYQLQCESELEMNEWVEHIIHVQEHITEVEEENDAVKVNSKENSKASKEIKAGITCSCAVVDEQAVNEMKQRYNFVERKLALLCTKYNELPDDPITIDMISSIQQLEEHNAFLMERYFVSTVREIKYQQLLAGNMCTVSPSQLYEEAKSLNICARQFESWIREKLHLPPALINESA